MYENETDGVRISVEPEFLEDESIPEDHRYVWAYTIEIENKSAETLQLLNRYWEIIDSQGRKEVVHGAGVVGEQPVLRPGGRFSYTSGAPLTTPSGFMNGHYEMQTEKGRRFDAVIPAFSLDRPDDHYSLQ